tara:strand:+ start:21 stop:3257 length:3237 start_codon:yes stop_codon:yes gene_type:complete
MATAFGVAQLAVGGFQKVVGFLSSQMKDSINVFKEFDFQMQKVRAISGATDLEFKRLKESAEALGRTTFFTATQVAELQTNLSKLGFTAEEILLAQNATLATATATGENLARTATVMGSAIRGFGLDASEATRVADVMASAFTSSALDIEKFQTSMTKVAPIAKMAGFEIEGTTAILASLTDAGIEASIAGTSLRNILLRLADPTSKLSKRLGGSVSSVDELLPRLKEMKDSGIALSDVLGITDRRTAAAFGRMLDSADNVAILTEQLRNSEGAAEAMAEIVGDSLQGAMLRFKSATDGLKLALVDLFGGNFQKLVDKFAKVFNNLASEKNIKRISKFAKGIGNIIKVLVVYTIGVKATAFATNVLAVATLRAGATLSGTFMRGLVVARGGLLAFKTAMISTGVGALVVGLGFLIAKLLETKEVIGELFSEQEFLNQSQKNSKENIESVSQSTAALINHKKELNKLTDEEGNLLNKSQQGQAIHNKRLQLYRKELASVNKVNKQYNQTLLTEKSSLEDIADATDVLISKMKDRMLQESFASLSKEYLDQAVSANLILSEFGEGFNFTDNVENDLETAIAFIREFDYTKSLEDVNPLVLRNDPAQLAAATLNDLLKSNDMALDDFEKAVKDGFYEEKTGKIADELQKQMSSGSSIFGTPKKEDEGDPKTEAIAAKIEKEAQRHSEALLDIGNKSYKFESDRNILKLEEEIIHLQTMKALNMKMGEDGIKEDLKIQKKRDKILEETNKLKLDALSQDNIDKKLQIDEDFANELMTELEHKQSLLDLEAWFLGQKADLIAQDFQAYLENQNAQRQLDIDAIDLEKQANQERIQAVDDLGSSMSELGNIMGENHILTKIGTKLSQAAAVAKNIETLRTLLQTKADEAATTTSLIKMTAEGGEGVTTQSKLPFPANIAAMAATLAVVVSVLSMFGGSGQSSESVSNTETMAAGGGGGGVKFANGGLTNGGMFKGASHANGGVKFASGGRIHEAEGGEAIINKRSTNMFKPVLSAINSYNGNGVKFADGGLLNSGEKFARGGQLSDVQSLISSSMPSQQQVVIVESEVTRTQGRVSAIESQATF